MNLPDFTGFSNFVEDTANDRDKLRRGMVWCTTCGRPEEASSGYCLRYGWPKCCGHTMTIDSPEERRVES